MINHNILHLIIRKCMDQRPHPLAQIMKPLLYDIETLVYDSLVTKYGFISTFYMIYPLYKIQRKYNLSSYFILYLSNIIKIPYLTQLQRVKYGNIFQINYSSINFYGCSIHEQKYCKYCDQWNINYTDHICKQLKTTIYIKKMSNLLAKPLM